MAGDRKIKVGEQSTAAIAALAVGFQAAPSLSRYKFKERVYMEQESVFFISLFQKDSYICYDNLFATITCTYFPRWW